MSRRITIARGDGIGPEIMDAALKVLEAAGAKLEYDEIQIGEKVYLSGNSAGIADKDWQTLADNKVFFKAPITTPQGGGYKSLNVTVRKTLGLYANVRPVKSFHPYVQTKHPKLDMVIVRENEEDLYGGIEHRQTDEVFQCLKLISKPGTERILRYAFEHAKQTGRKKVTCMTKDNIMKLTDGLFHKIFKEVASEYPDIESDHYIIDIGTARLADTPEIFDVIVLPNLYGDILSDVAAQIAGSVGIAGSANIGANFAMFEAIHGSAPDIAGQNLANPSGLILGGVHMLNYLGQGDIAAKIENAWLSTIESGLHTGDIYNDGSSKKKLSTDEFTTELISRLGETPKQLNPVDYSKASGSIEVNLKDTKVCKEKSFDGIDVFVSCEDRNPNNLGEKMLHCTKESDLDLQMITNRGVKVYPDGNPQTFCTDHWRCRFTPSQSKSMDFSSALKLQEMIHAAGIEVIKTEHLYSFDGEKGYSLGQGQ